MVIIFIVIHASKHIPNVKIVKNLSPVVIHCTFTMYWPKVYSISQWWNLCEKYMAVPPGQFIALQAINALKGTISGKAMKSAPIIFKV